MKNKFKQISLDKAYEIIKKPITTEKSTNLQQFNQYSFIVSKNSNSFEINVIPHSLKLTNLKMLKPNDLVNVELDIFSKYIYKYSN